MTLAGREEGRTTQLPVISQHCPWVACRASASGGVCEGRTYDGDVALVVLVLW